MEESSGSPSDAESDESICDGTVRALTRKGQGLLEGTGVKVELNKKDSLVSWCRALSALFISQLAVYNLETSNFKLEMYPLKNLTLLTSLIFLF